MNNSIILVGVLLWPLLLAGAMTYARTSRLLRFLVPWAAFPALIVAFGFSGITHHIPGTMLGAVLRMDASGRAFLMLVSVLSLAASLLVFERTAKRLAGYQFTLFLLLAISGASGLALAGDALLFFTSATLLGYSLYGMLVAVSPVAAGAARVFVVLLVVSDLALFELLLVLAHDAGGIAFANIRHALLLAESPVTILFLLLLSVGSKLGLIGFHIWLAPVFLHAAVPVRPMLLCFIMCAGMLAWLRLLPLGEVYWPGAGTLLQWLAMATLAYALVVGFLQVQLRSLLAYGVMALAALFLWVLGAVLGEPTLWPVIFTAMHAAIMQAGFAMALLFMLPSHRGMTISWRYGVIAIGWFAALMLVLSPLGIITTMAPFEPGKTVSLTGLGAAFALLTGRSLRVQSMVQTTPVRMLVIAGLSLSTLLVAMTQFFTFTHVTVWQPVLALLFAVVLGWFAGGTLARRLPMIPAGDLIAPVERGAYSLTRVLYQLADKRLPRLRKQLIAILFQLRADVDWRQHFGRLDAMLGLWPIAMLMLVLLGLTVAWWSAIE